MKILHYALGFPPYRTGGLTKFCMDLMMQQSKNGHEVALLWPGCMKLISKEISIRDNGNVKINNTNIRSFEIINPVPVPYDEGINDFDIFMKDGNQKPYLTLLKTYQPDVIHLHTLMGLHKNFLVTAKLLKVNIIFTAHDFFPLCPKVTMFHNGQICESVKSCEDCSRCNVTALSVNKPANKKSS